MRTMPQASAIEYQRRGQIINGVLGSYNAESEGTWQAAAEAVMQAAKAAIDHGEMDEFPLDQEQVEEYYRVWCELPGRGPGRPLSRGPLTRLDTRIRADVAAALDAISVETGTSKAQLIERAVLLAYPEKFCE